jgi:hypothetical protein
VRRTLRILRVTLTLLSLCLFIVSVVFWIRSLRAPDTIALTALPIRWSLSTDSGTLFLTCDRSWLDPAEVKRVNNPFTYQRSMLGFGIKQTQPIHSRPVPYPGIITYGTVTKTFHAPLWSCFLLFAILPAIEMPRLLRRLRRHNLGLCPHCGYDLRASPDKCPECGIAVKKQEIKRVALPKRL